jgi:hypothetical protein
MTFEEADIVRMTREAGGFDATPVFLKRFAERVAAHTLMNIDPSKFIGGYQEGFEAGVAKESEECAKLCQRFSDRMMSAGECADAIRARSKA